MFISFLAYDIPGSGYPKAAVSGRQAACETADPGPGGDSPAEGKGRESTGGREEAVPEYPDTAQPADGVSRERK